MPDQSSQNKTEQPTQKRKDDARKKGQVARSTEVNTAFILITGTGMLALTGPAMFHQFQILGREIFSGLNGIELTPNSIPGMAWAGAAIMFKALLPLWAVMLFVGLSANFGQVGIKVSEEAFKPKWNRLNVFTGMKNLFTQAPFELVKNLVKMLLVVAVVYMVLSRHVEQFFYLGEMNVRGTLVFIGKVGFELMAKVSAAVILIAAVDYAYQRYRHTKQIKMSKQEVKEEYKQTEGDPHVKSRLKEMQREMSRSRMMQDVPKADMVIVNPTHYAIAIKYDQTSMEAPKVLAKGMRKIAEKIKAIAREHDIPVIENPPLARSLYDLADIGDEIPTQFYRAIAEILARIYQMKK